MPGAGTRSVESPWLACQRVYWISAARSEIALRLWRHAMTLGNAMRPLCETKNTSPPYLVSSVRIKNVSDTNESRW